jgi:hypothetical protein
MQKKGTNKMEDKFEKWNEWDSLPDEQRTVEAAAELGLLALSPSVSREMLFA